MVTIASETRRGNTPGGRSSPFDLGQVDAYLRWRDWKLARAGESARMVEIRDPSALTASEYAELLTQIRHTNSALYATRHAADDKGAVHALARQLGLARLDGNLCADEDTLTSLRVMPQGTRHEGYIPYTNRPLNWHTDGYYNTDGNRIRAMLLHCARPAARGGESALLDHEIAYILLRDENPEYIAALMQADAMTIPANVENGVLIRPAQSGPVFLVEPGTGNLYMRYTARRRNIEWKHDGVTQEAAEFLLRTLDADERYVVRHRLEAGQGIVSNNALHNRTGFDNDAGAGGRLIYRGRYYDRVRGTDLTDSFELE